MRFLHPSGARRRRGQRGGARDCGCPDLDPRCGANTPPPGPPFRGQGKPALARRGRDRGRILQLVDARDGSERPATDIIDAADIPAAAAIGVALEGGTSRKRNPHAEGGLAWLAWIAAVFLPRHNARFGCAAAEPGSAYVQVPESAWRDVLCVQDTRQAGPDNTVRWKGKTLQIPPSPWRAHYVRASIRVSEYACGRIVLHHGPRRIASFTPDGIPEPMGDETMAA